MSNPDPAVTGPVWTPDALTRLERAPVFLRGMVRRLAEKKARELGEPEISGELLDRFKRQMMGSMGGEAGMAEAADQLAQGKLPWTAEASKRLDNVPEFMRAMIRQITEEVARERGHLEVNVELFEKVEAMGEQAEARVAPLEWTEGAQAMLRDKVRDSPPIALEFVTDMLKQDAEDLAREAGIATIDEETLARVWDAPKENVAWTGRRLETVAHVPGFRAERDPQSRGAAGQKTRAAGNRLRTPDRISERSHDESRQADQKFRVQGIDLRRL